MRPLYFQVLKTSKKLLFTHGITARLLNHFHFSHSLGLLVSSSKCFFIFFVTETLSKFGARRWLCGLWFSPLSSFRGLALEAQIEACASKWCVVIFHIHTYLHISHESVPNPSHGWKVEFTERVVMSSIHSVKCLLSLLVISEDNTYSVQVVICLCV